MAANELDLLRHRFGDNLKALRRGAELSRERVAERSGLHMSEIDLVERGLRLPLLGTIVRLGGALEVEPCELVAGMSWRPGRKAGQAKARIRRGRFELEPSGLPGSS